MRLEILLLVMGRASSWFTLGSKQRQEFLSLVAILKAFFSTANILT